MAKIAKTWAEFGAPNQALIFAIFAISGPRSGREAVPESQRVERRVDLGVVVEPRYGLSS